jgi:hypothetical protein
VRIAPWFNPPPTWHTLVFGPKDTADDCAIWVLEQLGIEAGFGWTIVRFYTFASLYQILQSLPLGHSSREYFCIMIDPESAVGPGEHSENETPLWAFNGCVVPLSVLPNGGIYGVSRPDPTQSHDGSMRYELSSLHETEIPVKPRSL